MERPTKNTNANNINASHFDAQRPPAGANENKFVQWSINWLECFVTFGDDWAAKASTKSIGNPAKPYKLLSISSLIMVVRNPHRRQKLFRFIYFIRFQIGSKSTLLLSFIRLCVYHLSRCQHYVLKISGHEIVCEILSKILLKEQIV